MTPLLYAAREGHIDVAKALLDAGVDVNQRKGGDRRRRCSWRPCNGQFDLAGMHARPRRQSEYGGRERRRPALRDDQPDVGAAGRLSAAAGAD